MTKFDQFGLRLRRVELGLATLQAALSTMVDKPMNEAAVAARPARKRAAAPRPSDAIITERQTLWSRFVLLHLQFGRGRVTKLNFATRHGLNPTEFGRWLSPTDRRGVPEGSGPDRSHRRALAAAIHELEARSEKNSGNTRVVSHGNMLPSQDSGARLH